MSRAQKGLASPKEVTGAPELVVEIASPSTQRTDRVAKAAIHADSGVRWYWVVDPEAKTLEEYEREGNQYNLERKWRELEMFEPRLFPGLAFPLADLFDWNELENA